MNTNLLALVKENQECLRKANSNMEGQIERQEREYKEREEVWEQELSMLRERIPNLVQLK